MKLPLWGSTPFPSQPPCTSPSWPPSPSPSSSRDIDHLRSDGAHSPIPIIDSAHPLGWAKYKICLSPPENSVCKAPYIQKGRKYVLAREQRREWSRQRGTSVILRWSNSSVSYRYVLGEKDLSLRLKDEHYILISGDPSKFSPYIEIVPSRLV